MQQPTIPKSEQFNRLRPPHDPLPPPPPPSRMPPPERPSGAVRENPPAKHQSKRFRPIRLRGGHRAFLLFRSPPMKHDQTSMHETSPDFPRELRCFRIRPAAGWSSKVFFFVPPASSANFNLKMHKRRHGCLAVGDHGAQASGTPPLFFSPRLYARE